MKYLAAPLLMLVIVVGYAGAVLGLAVVVHVVGPGTALALLLVVFAGCLWFTGRMR